ncbi:hypothetical protein QL093DRAFT_2121431 [Fusarium oxysporum]|nr:hypothetical protein QL093DRAFT_2121431 [Fusarium oxysporum]
MLVAEHATCPALSSYLITISLDSNILHHPQWPQLYLTPTILCLKQDPPLQAKATLIFSKLSDLISPSNQQPYPSFLSHLEPYLPKSLRQLMLPRATWTSFQTGRDEHMEFNSDIVFINHSCDPNLVVDTARMEVRVADDRHIARGDELTWFYPSAEWEMAQSFPCECGTERCLVAIRGSRYVEPEKLKGYFLNQHIHELMEEQ